MLEVLWVMLTTFLASIRPRQDLVLENLLLRHQLECSARRFCTGWREHLTFVTPDTVVRWHRRGWRLFRRGSPAPEADALN